MTMIRFYLTSAILVVFFGLSQAQPYGSPGVQTAVFKENNPSFWGYYEYLPEDFDANSGKKYPLVIFYHGIGEKGNGSTDLTRVLRHGPPKLAANGKDFAGIVISPQSSYGWFSAGESKGLYDYLTQNYPVDLDKVYVTGLSAGGGNTIVAIGSHPELYAAAVPVCAANKVSNPSENLQDMPIWAFHNFDDPTIGYGFTVDNMNRIINNGQSVMTAYPNSSNRALPADDTYTMSFDGQWTSAQGVVIPNVNTNFTLYPTGGHNAWSKAYEDDKLWEWLFAQSKSGFKVDAGADKEVDDTIESFVLSGTVNSSVSSMLWEKVSGPSAALGGHNTEDLTVSDIEAGEYIFKFSATSTGGSYAEDFVTVIVNRTAIPNVVTVDVGADRTISSSQVSILISGSAISEPGGTISRFLWEKVEGPNLTMANTTTAQVTLTDLSIGEYLIKLTATNNTGQSGSDTMILEVEGSVVNTVTVDAGADQAATVDRSSVTLRGSAVSSPSGTISTYSWSKVAGPEVYLFDEDTEKLVIAGYAVGTFTFRLTATDMDGNTAHDDVQVVIEPVTPVNTVTVDAGIDQTAPVDRSSVTLRGSAVSSPSGTISTYSWSKVAGPEVYLFDEDTEKLVIAGYAVGTYTFRLTATDMDGNTAHDDVQVVIEPVTPVNTVTVDAGIDQTAPVDRSSVTLRGSAVSSPSGTISTYSWSKVAGPEVYLFDKDTEKLVIAGYVVGTFTFRLTATDTDGNTAHDDVQVIIEPIASSNTVVVNAGEDKMVYTTQESLLLNGSASSNPGGTISKYNWTKEGGPTIAMSGYSTPDLTLTYLREGVYTFRLTATDTQGNVSSDDVQVTVEEYVAPAAPVAVVEHQKNIVGNTYTLVLDGSSSYDTDGEVVAYNWDIQSSSLSVEKQVVCINFADEAMMAGGEWNNTDGSTYPGIKIANAQDSKGNPTGIALTTLDEWGGSKIGGRSTGADSGPVPDAVMSSTYWFSSTKQEIKVTGLTVGKVYDFSFFASRTGWGDKTTIYTINGESASLDAGENVDEVVKLTGVYADNNGELVINISRAEGVDYGYLNSIVIESEGYHMQNSNDALATVSNLAAGTYTFVLEVTDNSGLTSQESVTVSLDGNALLSNTDTQANGRLIENAAIVDSKAKLYPNPFEGVVFIESGSEKLNVQISDASGRVLESFESTGFKRIDLLQYANAMFFVQVRYSDGSQEVLKLIRD